MLKDVVVDDDAQEHHHLPLEELLGTLSAQLLEYCNSDSIGETRGSLEPSYQCSDDPANFSLSLDGEAKDATSLLGGKEIDGGMASLSTILDAGEEDDISASIDFSTSPSVYGGGGAPVTALEFPSNQSERYAFSAMQQQSAVMPPEVAMSGGMAHFPNHPAGSLDVTQLPSVVDVCLSSTSSCNFLAANDMGMSFIHPNMNGASFCSDASGLIMGSMLGINGEMQTRDLDYFRGDAASSGIFYHNSQPGMFNPGDVQANGLESQNSLGGHPTSNPSLLIEISNPDDGAATFKVGKLSPEERKEKIDRYIRKRNERNFSKKIKYACRKTLADSRPRVRGRFAKNDDPGEASRNGCGNNSSDGHHEDDFDDEENNPTTSTTASRTTTEMFGHASGTSNFNCSFTYPIMDLNTFNDTQLGTF